MKNRKQLHGDYYKFILMALLKEGPLSLKELEERMNACLSWAKKGLS